MTERTMQSNGAVTGSNAVPATVNRRTARIAGLLYLGVGVFGGFAQGYAEPAIYAAGDAAKTAVSVLGNPQLARLGVVADLANQALFIFLAVTLYGLLKHVHRGAARAMLACVAIAVAIGSLNTVFLFEALRVGTEASFGAAWSTAGVNAVIMLLVELQHYGLLTAQIFFGLWLAPLGYLAYRSRLFPKALGGILVLATVCYLADVLLALLLPAISVVAHGYVVIPCAIAEIWMVLYLLIIGVREPGHANA